MATTAAKADTGTISTTHRLTAPPRSLRARQTLWPPPAPGGRPTPASAANTAQNPTAAPRTRRRGPAPRPPPPRRKSPKLRPGPRGPTPRRRRRDGLGRAAAGLSSTTTPLRPTPHPARARPVCGGAVIDDGTAPADTAPDTGAPVCGGMVIGTVPGPADTAPGAGATGWPGCGGVVIGCCRWSCWGWLLVLWEGPVGVVDGVEGHRGRCYHHMAGLEGAAEQEVPAGTRREAGLL